jgi:hypothetical protein
MPRRVPIHTDVVHNRCMEKNLCVLVHRVCALTSTGLLMEGLTAILPRRLSPVSRCCILRSEACIWRQPLTQSFTPLDSLLFNVILATLAIGLPILLVLSIRFLWDRNLNLGRSKELEKLIWQLHRIASAMEHQMNLSFPAVQPGTEELHDLAYLQQLAVHPTAATSGEATRSAATPTPATDQPLVRPLVPPPTADQHPSLPALERRAPSAEAPRAGVNSMFDL